MERFHFCEKCSVCAVLPSCICVLQLCLELYRPGGSFPHLHFTCMSHVSSFIAVFSSRLLVYIYSLKRHFLKLKKKSSVAYFPLIIFTKRNQYLICLGCYISEQEWPPNTSKPFNPHNFMPCGFSVNILLGNFFKDCLVLHEMCGKLWPLVCQTFIFKSMHFFLFILLQS